MLVKKYPRHARYTDGTDIKGVPEYNPKSVFDFGLEIPHLLNIFDGNRTVNELKEGTSAFIIVKPTDELKHGDEITDEYDNAVTITEIIERRPARGNWNNNPFCKKPDFIHISYL